MHGDEQVIGWSSATVGGVPIDQSLAGEHRIDRAALAEECRHQSESIIRAKGATPFGMGAIVASVCSSILSDRRNVRPLSHFQPEFGCYFSLPAVLGRKGIIRTLPISLDNDEKAKIEESAKKLRSELDGISVEL